MSRRRKTNHKRGPVPVLPDVRVVLDETHVIDTRRIAEAMAPMDNAWQPWSYELDRDDPIRYPTTLLPQVVGR